RHHRDPGGAGPLAVEPVEREHPGDDQQQRQRVPDHVGRGSGPGLFDSAVHSSRYSGWHARRDSNPQPAVLETAALPIELLAYGNSPRPPEKATAACAALPRSGPGAARWPAAAPGSGPRRGGVRAYLMIFDTTPAPTVRPPSRIAKRRPSSIAIGLISDTDIFTLSPGITISVPSGSVTAPVMSVVRK